ncbi:class I SAM-dependent methyltransferase [Tritonibacter mobilis]|nr:class I SAM-dependent methyltransferase [Tritonibacter mobilis]
MSQWSSGYNVDVGYTYGFYRELSPNWLDYVATVQGVSSPKGNARFLELGCGYGLGLVLLAGMHPDYEFLGIDFNPVHIAHGRKLVAEAGLTNVRFEEADFVDLAQGWPQAWGLFDYVTAHGTYTWLGKSVREAMVQTIKHATKPGAIVYLSYNTLPGWTSTQPVQHLLRLWQTTEETQSIKAISQGINRFKVLADANSGMTQALPTLNTRIEDMEKHDRSYLVHEYLHDNWHPLWFSQLADEISAAKLAHVGSASVGDLYLQAVLPPAQKDILAQYEDPVVREVMVDVLVNQTFRKDVFVRGKTPMWPADQKDAILDTAFVLMNRPKDEEFTFKLSAGEVSGKTDVYKPLLEALDTGPKTIRDLMSAPFPSPRTLGDTLQAMTFMLHAGFVGLHSPIAKKKPAKALNRAIVKSVAQGAPYNYLIAPEIGNVLQVKDTDMIMLHEVLNNPATKDANKLGQKLVTRLLILGKGLVQEGQALRDNNSMVPYAVKLAEGFLETTFENWKKLGVI